MLFQELVLCHRLEPGAPLQCAPVEGEANARHAATEAFLAAWLGRLATRALHSDHAKFAVEPIGECDSVLVGALGIEDALNRELEALKFE